MLVFTSLENSFFPYPTPNAEANIFISYKINGEWSLPIDAGKTLNFTSDNEAVGISPDGLKLLLCYDNGKYGKDLYESSFNGTEWSKPYNLGDKYQHKIPMKFLLADSPDCNSIYFISDKTVRTVAMIYICHAKVNGKKA